MLQTALFTGSEAIDKQSFTDAQLLALIGRGENWALSEIHARYARLVFSIALKILNEQASAEEIVQQVFTEVWRHARHYRLQRGKFSAWVSTITRHQCIDELRRRRVRPTTEPGDWESLDRLAGNDDPARMCRIHLSKPGYAKHCNRFQPRSEWSLSWLFGVE